MGYMIRTVCFDGTEIRYQFERKSVKNLNLRIRKDCSVYVSANSRVRLAQVDAFVLQKGEYILAAIRKFSEMAQEAPQPKQYISGETFYVLGEELRLKVLQGVKERVEADGAYICLYVQDTEDFAKKQRLMTRYLAARCREVFEEILREQYPSFWEYGVSMPKLRIRDMKTRWGSCTFQKGVITLNKRLLGAPRSCIEYVCLHELCHFIHPNHSKQFYDFLARLMPDWKERKGLLARVSARL